MFQRPQSIPPGLLQQWKQTQAELRERVLVRPLSPVPRFVAGADCAFSADRTTLFATAVVYDREERRIVEVRHAHQPVDVPYVPGFLSFREGPAVLAVVRALQHPFGVITFDGQGVAHPRRCGLATYLGVTLDVPSIGVAKRRLIGTHGEPGRRAGSAVPLMDHDEQIGLVLRTKDATRPVYVSVGHRVDLPSAAEVVLACRTRYRIPEPTRVADIEVGKFKQASNVRSAGAV